MSEKTAAEWADELDRRIDADPNMGLAPVAVSGMHLRAIIAEVSAAAEERGRNEIRALLRVVEKDRDTWKRLCEKADAQATAATVRANKLANKRGYDIDDDAEERGRRRGVEERDELRECLKQALGIVQLQASRNPVPYNHKLLARIDAALAPRDSALNAKIGRSEDGLPVVNFDRDALHERAPRDSAPDSSMEGTAMPKGGGKAAPPRRDSGKVP